MDLKAAHSFSPGRPIENKTQDLLFRTHFTKNLTKAIVNWKENESLVVGIYGQWGDGKTSVVNLVKEELDLTFPEKTLLLEFNPWQWSDNEDLFQCFLKELVSLLKSQEKTSENLIKSLKTYSEYLTLGSEATSKVKSIVDKLSLPAGLFLGIITVRINEKYLVTLFWVALILISITIVFDTSAWLINFFLKFYSNEPKTLEERKRNLVTELGLLEKTIVVIIDDIDRLQSDEIRTLFKFVKANTNFPKITYVTLFQRNIVENALTDSQNKFLGKDYLEKIIHVGFNLPSIPNETIRDILFKKIDVLLIHFKVDTFNQGRWSELVATEIFSFYFENLRDVNRFISTLTFNLGAVSLQQGLEVNFIDFLALEIIRQFEPNIFNEIYQNKAILTSNPPSSDGKNEKDRIKEILNRIIGLSESNHQDVIRDTLKFLFPNIHWAWSNFHSSVSSKDFRNLRICHKNLFDRYFSLYLAETDFGKYEFEAVLNSSSDENKLIEIFDAYLKQNRFENFIEKFSSYKEKIPKKHAVPFLSAMMTICDWSKESNHPFEYNSSLYIENIVHSYFNRQKFNNKKELFIQALNQTSGIYLPLKLLYDEYQRISKYPEELVFEESDKELARKLFIELIGQKKHRLEFTQHNSLPRIIRSWQEIDLAGATKWFAEFSLPDLNFVHFLRNMRNKSVTSSGYDVTETFVIPISWLSRFFPDLEAFFQRIENMKNKDSKLKDDDLFKTLEKSFDEFKHPEKYREDGREEYFENED